MGQEKVLTDLKDRYLDENRWLWLKTYFNFLTIGDNGIFKKKIPIEEDKYKK